MKTIIIGDFTAGIEMYISSRGLVEYYHLPKTLSIKFSHYLRQITIS